MNLLQTIGCLVDHDGEDTLQIGLFTCTRIVHCMCIACAILCMFLCHTWRRWVTYILVRISVQQDPRSSAGCHRQSERAYGWAANESSGFKTPDFYRPHVRGKPPWWTRCPHCPLRVRCQVISTCILYANWGNLSGPGPTTGLNRPRGETCSAFEGNENFVVLMNVILLNYSREQKMQIISSSEKYCADSRGLVIRSKKSEIFAGNQATCWIANENQDRFFQFVLNLFLNSS